MAGFIMPRKCCTGRCIPACGRPGLTLPPSGDQSQRRRLRSKPCWCPTKISVQRSAGAKGCMSHILRVLSAELVRRWVPSGLIRMPVMLSVCPASSMLASPRLRSQTLTTLSSPPAYTCKVHSGATVWHGEDGVSAARAVCQQRWCSSHKQADVPESQGLQDELLAAECWHLISQQHGHAWALVGCASVKPWPQPRQLGGLAEVIDGS